MPVTVLNLIQYDDTHVAVNYMEEITACHPFYDINGDSKQN